MTEHSLRTPLPGDVGRAHLPQHLPAQTGIDRPYTRRDWWRGSKPRAERGSTGGRSERRRTITAGPADAGIDPQGPLTNLSTPPVPAV